MSILLANGLALLKSIIGKKLRIDDNRPGPSDGQETDWWWTGDRLVDCYNNISNNRVSTTYL